MLQIGFTGTQRGMTSEQNTALFYVFVNLFTQGDGEATLHHGDCVGADFQAHSLFHDLLVERDYKGEIVIHPGHIHEKRAYSDRTHGGRYGLCDLRILSTKHTLERNEDVVAACDVLVCAPHSVKEYTRSGTWSTVRKARRQGVRIVSVYPTGEVVDTDNEIVLGGIDA